MRMRSSPGMHCGHILFYNRVLDELSSFDLSRFPAARAYRADHANSYGAFLLARRGNVVALPVAAGQRASAADRRSGARERCVSAWQSLLSTRRPGTRSCRSSSARPRIASGIAWFARPTGPTSPAAPAIAPARPPTPSSRWCSIRTSPISAAPVNYDRDDLLGGYPAPRRYVGWQTFFDFGDGNVKNNKKIDTTDLKCAVHPPGPRDRAAHADSARPCCRSETCCASSPGDSRPVRPSPARWASQRSTAVRPGRDRRRIRAVRAQHAALVLRPRGGEGDRWRHEPRPGWRPDRCRDADRPATRRPEQLPERQPALSAVSRD